MTRRTWLKLSFVCGLLLAGIFTSLRLSAAVPVVISLNFVGNGTAMGATESAGVVSRTNWTNATGASRTTALTLNDDSGAATTARVTWTSDNVWGTPITDQAGNRRLMKGYLDNGSNRASTVTVTGLTAGAYDIYVYADGDNTSATRSGVYQISGTGITTTSISLTDAPNTNFNTTFTQATNSAGNFVKFSITATGFRLTATPGSASDNTPRAPISGIQIVSADGPSDTTPPVRASGLPAGTVAAGTTQATLSLTTDETATCRYGSVAGVTYGSLPTAFTTTGAAAHATTVSGLTNGGSYTYFVRCMDTAGNVNTNDFAITFSVAIPADTTPPARGSGQPTGTLPSGTTQTTLSLTTNEPAVCRYGPTAGVTYAAQPSPFTTTGGTAHSTIVSGLTNGSSYSLFVRCVDAASNANPDDFSITFAVAQPADTTPAVRTNGQPAGTLTAGTTQTTLSLVTSEPATCRYGTVAGVAYGSLPGVFTTTGGTAQSTTVTGLADGGSYLYFVRCSDGANNVNPDDFPIGFSVAQPADTTPPARAAAQPAGTLTSDTTQATLSLTTDEASTCRYGTVAGVAYGALPALFSATGGTTHSTLVTGLTSGSYTYFVRCMDAASNVNPDDFVITFAVAQPPDTTPPARTAGQPSGTLTFATTQTTLSLTTDEPATCRYGTVAGLAYGALPAVFATTGATAHATPVTGLTDGTSYTYYVRCSDAASNANADDFVITFAVAQPPDTTPPVRATGQPAGTVTAGTTQTTLSLTTSEPATCRYGTSPGVAYGSLPVAFTTTGGTSHSTPVTGLTDGGSYTYYVRCSDAASNANPDDFAIAFAVAQPPDTIPPVRTLGQPVGTLVAGTTQATLGVTTNEAATCRYGTVAGVAYASLTGMFTTTGATTHATSVTGLTNGSSYTYYVRCSDVASNANVDDFVITFSVALPADTTPPTRTAAQPAGTLAAGTTQTTLGLTTNEAATCRYGTAAGVAYASLTGTFATTGATLHTTAVTGLTNGSSYTYYVRCSDAAGNANPNDFTITFAVAQPTGLRAAYSLNEGSGTTTPDTSGNGQVGTISGATWTASGKFGGALSFNGTSNYVSVPSTSFLGLTTGTLEAWVRLSTLARWNAVIAKGSVNADASHNYAIEIDTSNVVNCEIGSGTSYNVVTSTSQLAANQFYHLACTWDGSQLRLYLNGVLNRSVTQTITPAANSAPLLIGQYGGSVDRFAGVIDEVRLYNTALSLAQIQSDMNTPVVNIPPDTTPPVRSAGQPSGTLAAGTTQATLGLTTSETATCRYGPVAGVAYGALPTVFTTTGATAQATTVTGLTNGGSYTYYVRCSDAAGNVNPDDFAIGFAVAQPVPDFTVAATPGSQTVIQGAATSYTATIGAINGFAGTVTLGVSGAPAGVTAAFTPVTVSGSGSAVLNVTTAANTPIGTTSLTLTATSGALTHSTLVSLVVVGPTYAMSGVITPAAGGASATVNLGGGAAATTTANASGNYSFAGLANGSYVVTPVKPGYSFAPVSRNVTISGAAVSGVDFTATQSAATVSITSPANGATVSGAFSISATASAGVAGVQFRVDGVNVGAEDTTSPYAASVTAVGGSHTLTAVARDSAGATVTSAPVSVVVSAGTGTALGVNGSQKSQTMDGFGVNINALSWKNGQLQPALDMLSDQMGATLWRVCYDMGDWESTNDDASPTTQNWTYYNALYSNAKFQNLWGTLRYMNQKGIRTGIAVSFMGRVPTWMGGSVINTAAEDEWVETIWTLFYYARNTEHLDFDIIDPINEPDWDGIEGPQVSASQYTRLMRKLSLALDANGMSDLRYLGPNTSSVTSGVTTYMPQMLSDSVVMGRVDHFAFHDYGGNAGGADNAIKSSAYPTKNFWMTEFTTSSDILSLLSQGPTGLLVWEAYDSVFNHAILAGRGSVAPNDDTAGPALLAYNSSTGIYTPRVGFYQVQQMIKFVPKGAVRIAASESSSSLTVFAFYDQVSRRVTIIGRNTSSSAISLTGTVTNLPAIGALQLYQTYGSNNFVRGADVLVTGGSFFTTVQGNGYFTLTAIIP